MTITRTQWKRAQASSGNFDVTLDSTPAEGSLIFVTMVHRTGVTADTAAVTGYTKILERNVRLSEASPRRGIAHFYKVAGASESASIAGTWTDAGTSGNIFAQVFSPSDWDYLASASNDNDNTADALSIASGTTSSLSAGTKLLIASAMSKGNAGDVEYSGLEIYDNDPLNLAQTGSGGFQQASDFDLDDTSGTKSVTMSWTGPSTNLGNMGSIVAFGYVAESVNTPTNLNAEQITATSARLTWDYTP